MRDRKPRLLMLITLSELGGAQTAVALLLPGLVGEFEVTLAAQGSGPLRDAAEAAGARYVELRHVRRPIDPWHDALALAELIRLCRRDATGHRPRSQLEDGRSRAARRPGSRVCPSES